MKISKKTIVLAILLPFQYLLVQFLSQNPVWIEKYYSTHFFPFVSKTLRILLGWIPFSFGDIVGFVLLFLFIKSLFQLIRSKFKNFISKTITLIAYLSVIYFCFYAFWGLNYFREPLAKKLNLQQSSYTTQQLLKTTDSIISLLNRSHFNITKNDTLEVIVPYSTREIYDLAPNGFHEVSKTHPEFAYSSPSIKNSIVSVFQSYNGTSGYINPITGEAQVNSLIPKTGYPATTCHEMAHQIGWAAENDANFIGFLTSINNSDLYFKYAGYRMAYQYCIKELFKRDKNLAQTLKAKVHKGVYKDYKHSYLFWKSYENPIEPYFKKGYNSYLKANNQTKGISSYSYVVDLFIAYFEKHQPQL
ncbi:Protein of unknown function [Tenacibaculum sp. MAR_2009_124]|uniref:DUF3810 domain-containing protein n=1 Tax=Tenacibaculum sp. MAR_2009_124 TaxID=1250059 RepID=UPI0008969DBE|nr:DUF3810 domain-containing protein [Tenacibaculum sp. MAR_2009_124]SEB39543.1 Protein of unknown function [Tenacibaculum sp. MAR_2009_124]